MFKRQATTKFIITLIFDQFAIIQFYEPIDNLKIYSGSSYWFGEPTPQQQDFRIGQMLQNLKM